MDGVVDLAFRESGGLEVTLLWSRSDESFLIVVTDAWTGETFAVSASSADAMDVFHHPFAYRSRAMTLA